MLEGQGMPPQQARVVAHTLTHSTVEHLILIQTHSELEAHGRVPTRRYMRQTH